jgi:hypothetical protein
MKLISFYLGFPPNIAILLLQPQPRSNPTGRFPPNIAIHPLPTRHLPSSILWVPPPQAGLYRTSGYFCFHRVTFDPPLSDCLPQGGGILNGHRDTTPSTPPPSILHPLSASPQGGLHRTSRFSCFHPATFTPPICDCLPPGGFPPDIAILLLPHRHFQSPVSSRGIVFFLLLSYLYRFSTLWLSLAGTTLDITHVNKIQRNNIDMS